MLTTPAIGPEQLQVVWTLTLQPESEGPTLISCAVRLLSGGHLGLLSAPSWRTVIGVAHHFWRLPSPPPWKLLASDVSSSPTHLQLCSTGFAVGFCVTAFHSRFHGLRISRYRGECASPLHLRDRNLTCTKLKLSKTSRSSPSIPDCESHFGGTDRTHSCLSTVIGSSFVARRAGSQLANVATSSSRKEIPINVTGSVA